MRTPMLTRRGGDDMSGKSIISNSYLEDIGDAIRYKKGTEETFYPSQMGDAIRSIEGIVPVGSIEIDANGVYDVTEKAEAVVNVVPDLRPLSVNENGQYSPDGFDGYSNVTVDVRPEVTYDELASGAKPSGDITLSVTNVATTVFRDKTAITSIHAPNCVSVVNFAFSGCSGVTEIEFPKLENVGTNAFTNIRATRIVLPALKTAGAGAFASQAMVRHICVGENVETLAASFFNNMLAGWSIKLKGKPTSIATNAFASTNSGDIYVPWSEGEVANAPWGATSATIHYDTVYDSEWNVISST